MHAKVCINSQNWISGVRLDHALQRIQTQKFMQNTNTAIQRSVVYRREVVDIVYYKADGNNKVFKCFLVTK